MVSQNNDGLCSYLNVKDNLHKFVFKAGNRTAVKRWADHVEQLQLTQKWYNHDLLRLLLDATAAPALPVRVFFEYLSDYNRPYPDLSPPKLRIALLHTDQFEIKDVYYQFADLMTAPTTIEFFKSEQEALDWLQQA